MGIKFDPTEAAGDLLAEGKYDVAIEAVEQKTGKTSGTRYLKLSLRAFPSNGPETAIFDNVMLEGRGTFRLKNLMCALGMREQFDKGEIEPSELVGKNLTAELEIEEDAQYGDKNVVKKYHAGTSVGRKSTPPAAKKPTPGGQQAAAPIDADDIPF